MTPATVRAVARAWFASSPHESSARALIAAIRDTEAGATDVPALSVERAREVCLCLDHDASTLVDVARALARHVEIYGAAGARTQLRDADWALEDDETAF